jgi:hypothetical protein
MKLSRSPDRGTFHIEAQLKQVEEGKTTVEQAQTMVDFYKSHAQYIDELEATDEWKKDNMEYDLRSTQWIIDKVKSSDVYAQNLYAAMCNNEFTKNDVIPILTEKKWSCSWRHAGGIIADMQEKGDYINWYCSGIRGDEVDTDPITSKYVSETTVTDEIRSDLLILGWITYNTENTSI